MGRSPLFQRLRRVAAIANYANKHGISTAEAAGLFQAHLAARRAQRAALSPTRRGLLKGVGAAALGASALRPRPARAAPTAKSDARVAVVGAGMAGLSAARALSLKGVFADIFDASDRPGGRVWSMGGGFPGPVDFGGVVIERGGELIDTGHTTMRGYATEFGFELEDYDKAEGEEFYWVDGALYDEEDVIDEYREFSAVMREDMKTLTPPTAESHTTADELLDYTSLAAYLDDRGPGNVLRGLFQAAYVGEYGRELDDQSCLNLLLFIHADNSSNVREFGVYSDERFHLVGGNQQIPDALAAELADQLQWGMKLVRIASDSAGATVLTFDDGGGTVEMTYDYVILAIPFSVLRHVELDPSLDFPTWKSDIIQNYSYGRNSKMMVRFDGRPWAGVGNNGGVYADGLANLANTWETNGANAHSGLGVLTNYSGGDLAESYDTGDVQPDVQAFLDAYDTIFPGASAVVSTDGGGVVVHLEKWSENPLTEGSYTNNAPGYFTTIADLEAVPVGRIYFAGEHADSFYAWQGFMEGASNSGLAAAKLVLAELRIP
jgi:monoamine oxidase